jgi:hypothetical protein
MDLQSAWIGILNASVDLYRFEFFIKDIFEIFISDHIPFEGFMVPLESQVRAIGLGLVKMALFNVRK